MSIERQTRERLKDVSAYLRSLRSLEKRYSKPGRGFYRASAALAISRASALIMIYNCVEYGVREALVDIRNDIKSSAPSFVSLVDHWKDEIVRAHFKERLEQGGEFSRLLRDVGEFIPGRIDWRNKLRELPFSGNIDHVKLIKFAQKIGEARWRPPKGSLGGHDLELIRRTRNQLAHGEETFENVGALYSTDDIIVKLRRVRAFMSSFIKMLEQHKGRQRYLRR